MACLALVPHATCSLERGFDGQLRQEGSGPTQPWVLCGVQEWWQSLFVGPSGGGDGAGTRYGHCLLLDSSVQTRNLAEWSRRLGCLRKGPAFPLSAGALGFSPPSRQVLCLDGGCQALSSWLALLLSLPPPLTSFSLFSPPWMDSHRPQLQRKELLSLTNEPSCFSAGR